MRIDRDRLAFHALCVLAEAIRAAKDGRVPPNPSLRLALAILAKLGGSAELVDLLWEELTRRDECGDMPGSIGRVQMLNAGFSRAVVELGFESDLRLDGAITRAISRESIPAAPSKR